MIDEGTRLGPYEIQSALGGMGQVFRAKDTRLDRVVASTLFVAEMGSDYGVNYPYAVSNDGRRVLVETIVKEAGTSPMTVTVNWTSALEK